MAAAAFTQTLIFRGQRDGRVLHIASSVDDVAANFATFPDGNNFLQLPADQVYQLVDIIVVTGGTDTNFQEIFKNGLSTGLKISNKSNLNTSNFRQFMTAPVAFAPGSLLKFKESAA